MRFFVTIQSFPIATHDAAVTINARGRELVESIGDTTGPYTLVTSYTTGVPTSRPSQGPTAVSLRYQMEGQTKTYQVPSLEASALHVNVFRNPRGNNLLVILKERILDTERPE